MKLYTAWYCPFAQRAWIGLVHKDVAFECVETDPYDKTADWMRVSRGTGQVPVLVDECENGVTVTGSIRVLEYIDQRFADVGPALFPESAAGVAEAKYWLDYQGSHIVPYFYRLLKAAPGSDGAEQAKRQMERGLEAFTAQMDQTGPYFCGAEVGVVDIALAPFALRIEMLLAHYKNYALPQGGGAWPRYHRWWEAMGSFAPLAATSTDFAQYTERLLGFYLPYSTGGGQEDVTLVS